MATQVTNVYVKRKNDIEWTELEKVYNGDDLIFQKSPAGYNYARITLTITPSALKPNVYLIHNDSQYTVIVGWTIGVVAEYPPDSIGEFPLGANPIWAQVNGLPTASVGALNISTFYADCPVSYKYLRNLYVK